MANDDDITMIPDLAFTQLYPYNQPPRLPLQTWPPAHSNRIPFVYDLYAPGPSNTTRIIKPLPTLQPNPNPRFLPVPGLSEDSRSPAAVSPRSQSVSPAPPMARRKPPKAKPRAPDEPLLAPDYSANPAGPASDAATIFKCSHCDKTYKGKHGRS